MADVKESTVEAYLAADAAMSRPFVAQSAAAASVTVPSESFLSDSKTKKEKPEAQAWPTYRFLYPVQHVAKPVLLKAMMMTHRDYQQYIEKLDKKAGDEIAAVMSADQWILMNHSHKGFILSIPSIKLTLYRAVEDPICAQCKKVVTPDKMVECATCRYKAECVTCHEAMTGHAKDRAHNTARCIMFRKQSEFIKTHLKGGLRVCSNDKCSTEGATYTCGACSINSYCGPTCQKADWALHKNECESHHKQKSARLAALSA